VYALALLVAFVTAAAATASLASAKRDGLTGKIAFGSSEDDPAWDIWIMNADGSGRVNLTPGRPESDTQPDWSPDGSRIVFLSIASDGNWDLWVIDADGTDLRRLTTDPARDSNPAWSPDGEEIVFRSERTGNSDIYVMDANGLQVQRLTSDPSREAHPSYSADGDKIVFDRQPPTALFTMNADGTNVRQITPQSVFGLQGDWSPRRNRIVFTNGFCGPCPFNDVVTVKPNGTELVQLTNDIGVGGNFATRWSPDGRKIVFAHQPAWSTPSDLHVINSDGSGRVNITGTPDIDEITPDWWQPDDGD
jgi:TolB protein